MSARTHILSELAKADGELHGSDILDAPGGYLSSHAFYIAVYQLEHEGLVRSRWDDGPEPRRRLYALTYAGQLAAQKETSS